MDKMVRRIWLVTLAAVILFAFYEALKTLLFPNLSLFASHIITITVAGILTFFVSRYALARYGEALMEIERQNARTEETNRILCGVLSGMREGVIIVNRALEVVLFNSAASQVVNLPYDAALSTTPQSLEMSRTNKDSENLFTRSRHRLSSITRDPSINKAFAQAIENGQPVSVRVEMTTQDHRIFLLRVESISQDLMAGVFFDITELERLEKVRREFFANLSHELRTPLTAILACSETLLGGAINDPEHGPRFLERLHKHAARMNDLVSDISDLSAIESHGVQLQLEPIYLRDTIDEVVTLLENRAASREVSIHTESLEDTLVLADRVRLEQILLNLIDNGVKFNKPGGAVTIRAKEDGEKAVITIEDTGVGIPSMDIPRVFERLYRVDKSRSRRIEGTGLGLAIVKHLVQAHGGEVSVSSLLGKGSTFTFSMPLVHH